MHDGVPITFAILTCRHSHLIADVLGLFRRNCRDFDLIDDWVILDNTLEPAQGAWLQELPDFDLIPVDPKQRGSPAAFETLVAQFDSGFLIYWSDDAVLPVAGDWITQSCDILKASPDLVQVLWDQDIFSAPWYLDNPDAGIAELPAPHRRYILPPDPVFVTASNYTPYVDPWPGFALRPHILDLGKFRVSPKTPPKDLQPLAFEYELALACLAEGLEVASLIGSDICDIGTLSRFPSAVGPAETALTEGQINHVVQVCADRFRPELLESRITEAIRWLRFDHSRKSSMRALGKSLMVGASRS